MDVLHAEPGCLSHYYRRDRQGMDEPVEGGASCVISQLAGGGVEKGGVVVFT